MDSLVEAEAGHGQESERSELDMVVQAGDDQRGREHVGGMPCHGMDDFGQCEQAPVFGR
jgi:hypothetical protein